VRALQEYILGNYFFFEYIFEVVYAIRIHK